MKKSRGKVQRSAFIPKAFGKSAIKQNLFLENDGRCFGRLSNLRGDEEIGFA